jgi:NAD(P)-dependent dehydrogenase (short-subunit alcohol dehydrogenase family)
VATGLLGMVRGVAMEGADRGWRVNAVSHRDDETELEPTVEWLGTARLTGQLVRVTADHLGRIWP